jgi:ribose transport system permease protein
VLGQGLELSVISAVLLGGVAFTGGSGSLLGVAAAVLFIGVLDNGLILAGVSAYWQQVSSGIALVAAAALTALTHKWRVATRGR